jgi:hypothetical protein
MTTIPSSGPIYEGPPARSPRPTLWIVLFALVQIAVGGVLGVLLAPRFIGPNDYGFTPLSGDGDSVVFLHRETGRVYQLSAPDAVRLMAELKDVDADRTMKLGEYRRPKSAPQRATDAPLFGRSD